MTGPDLAPVMVAELIAQARAWSVDPGLSETSRRESAAYARGLEQALYILAGPQVEAAGNTAA